MQSNKNILNNYSIRTFIFFSIFLIFIYPIIHANFFHIDDLGRSLSGYYGWKSVGRPFANFIYKLITLNPISAIDISPLSTVIGILTLALACAAVAELDQFKSYVYMLPLSFLGISPFMIANYSYRYDSLFMPIAIAFSIIPYYFFYKFNRYISFVLATLSILAAYNLYQPAINDFLELFLLIIISFLLGFKKNISLVLALFSFLAGSVMYKVELIITSIVPASGFAGSHAKLIFSGQVIEQNLMSMLRILESIAKEYPEKLLIIVAIISLCVGFIVFYRIIHKYILSIIILSFGIPLIFGPMLFLENPIYESIVFIGVGGFLATTSWLSIFIFGKIIKNDKAKVLIFVFMAYPQIVVSYAYGNAQYSQKEFINAIGYSIDNEIYKITHGKSFYLGVYGVIPIAPRAKILNDDYRIISRSIDRPLNWHWYWGKIFLYSFSDIKLIHRLSNKKVNNIITECKISGYKTYKYIDYNLYYNKNNKYLLIDFDKKCD